MKNNIDEKTIRKIIHDELFSFKKKYLSFRSKLSFDNPRGAYDPANSRTVNNASFLPISGGTVSGDLGITGKVGFYGTTPASKPTVTGSKGGNAALASLLTALASQGLIVDNTT